ncbi:MAG: PfkB family carbohydrate kinase [Candidatus Woesearchaeota archaeon]
MPKKTKSNPIDIAMIGHLCIDFLAEQDPNIVQAGGSVYYSAPAAVLSGASVRIVTKLPIQNEVLTKELSGLTEIGVEAKMEFIDKPTILSYGDPFEEDTGWRLISAAKPFLVDRDLSDINAKIYHISGVVRREFSYSQLDKLKARKSEQDCEIALDVQGFMREPYDTSKRIGYTRIKKIRKFLYDVDYLKVNLREAQILCNHKGELDSDIEDMELMAVQLGAYGAREVVITHRNGVVVYDSVAGETYVVPFFVSGERRGEIGKGSTCFGAYIAGKVKELNSRDAVYHAAALTSLKLQHKGPANQRDQTELERKVDMMMR